MSTPNQIITQIPSPEELAQRPLLPPREMRATTLPHEAMAGYYYPKSYDKEQVDGEFKMLKSLRDELSFAKPGEEMVNNAYRVARNIGDAFINEHGEAGQDAWELVDHTRYSARPAKWGTISSEGSIGQHSRSQKTMWLNHDMLLTKSHGSHQASIEAAVELKSPQDALLLSYLSTTAHEAGHTILSGISDMVEMKGVTKGFGGLSASATYLDRNPSQGFTGNLTNDTCIQEERFAEGYGRMVVSRAMEVLGYDDADVQKVMDVILLKPDVEGGPGENQIDYIRNASHGASIGVQIKSSHPDANSNHHYEGDLGYAVPLTIAEVIGQLQVLSTACKQSRLEAIPQETYAERNQAARDPTIDKHIADLEMARKSYLNPSTSALITGVPGFTKEPAEQIPKAEAPQATKRRKRISQTIASRLVRSLNR